MLKFFKRNWIKYTVISSLLLGTLLTFAQLFPTLYSQIPTIAILVITALIFIMPFIFVFLWAFINEFLLFILRKLRLYFLLRQRITIKVAFGQEYSDEIVEYCNSKIDKMNLSGQINFIPEKSKTNQNKFEKKVKRSNGNVLYVWMDNDKKGERNLIRFTFSDTLDKKLNKILNLLIANSQSRDNFFKFSSGNLKLDINLEKDNILHHALYIVAMVTALFRDLKKGSEILETLKKEIPLKQSSLSIEIKKRLIEIYITLSQRLTIEKKPSWDDYLEAEILLDKSYALDNDNYFNLCNLAVIKFKLGKEPVAKELVRRLKDNFPDNDISFIDSAFFALHDNDFPNCLRFYSKLRKIESRIENIHRAIEFFNEQIDEKPDKIVNLFGRGFLKMLIVNKDDRYGESSYKEDFKAFYDRSNATQHYILREYLEKRNLFD